MASQSDKVRLFKGHRTDKDGLESDSQKDGPNRSSDRSLPLDIGTASLSMPAANQDDDYEGFLKYQERGVGEGHRSSISSWHHTSTDEGSISRDCSINDGTSEEYAQFIGLDETTLIQAVVFIEDAYKYRTINHKVDERSLRLYRRYYSTPVNVFLWLVIFVLHMLAFFETPSSLTWSSDLRDRGYPLITPCWLLETIEFICLLLLVVDNIIKAYLKGRHYFTRHWWDVAACLILFLSIIDWAVSAALGCNEIVRFRRMLRPFFMLQNSSLMKKTVNCLRRTMPQVISVLVMLAMHLYIFTLLGMLMFPVPQVISGATEGDKYFSSLLDSFISLLVLLTTANNPDITLPAYRRNRLFSIIFIIFLVIGLYCFFNMLTAVIYNQFRGYFLNSMQSSLDRRRLGVRAAFEVLRRKETEFYPLVSNPSRTVSEGVGGFVIKAVLEKAKLPKSVKEAHMEIIQDGLEHVYSVTEFQQLFKQLDMPKKPPTEIEVPWCDRLWLRRFQTLIVHKYFSYLGILMAFANILLITVELGSQFHETFDDRSSDLRIANFVFANYYVLEQLLKIWANGPRRYISDKGNIFDATLTLALVIGELYSVIRFGIPFFYSQISAEEIATLWNVLRIINILIMVRLLKIIPLIKSMRVVFSVLMDLLSNLKAFAGILIVVYYVFALLGMELFYGVIKYNNITDTVNVTCGSYQQLEYWPNNFDDFAATVVVLWDLMVVNNWMVFLYAYREVTSAWAYLYFIAWWLISVIIVMNLFTALIMENFIMKWDRMNQCEQSQDPVFSQPIVLNTVHDMFRGMLKEPTDNELLKQLCLHKHLHLDS